MEKDSQKVNKSFSGVSTAASKKQRQALKGMLEGQNQNNSIPGSSSKRKTVSVILFDFQHLSAVLTLLSPLDAAFVESLAILGKQLEHQVKEGPAAARASKHQQLWGSVAHW